MELNKKKLEREKMKRQKETEENLLEAYLLGDKLQLLDEETSKEVNAQLHKNKQLYVAFEDGYEDNEFKLEFYQDLGFNFEDDD